MPLIIVTGSPCSGKTYRAQQIADYLSKRIAEDSANSRRTVQVIDSNHALSDTSANIETTVNGLRDQIYTSATREKTARAEEFSAIKRALSKDSVVIADGLNYIKGYRYQLWCEAKAAGTRCCVVHVAAQESECKQWNGERLRVAGREAEIEKQVQIPGEQSMTQGKDVLGELMPESHTAIYGDRVVEENRSRSSSVDALDNGDGPRPEDTMTLKSLYISDKTDPPKISPSTNDHNAQHGEPNPAPPAQIPPSSSAQAYAPSTLTSLIMRYEPPSPFSRWDTPSSPFHPPTPTHPIPTSTPPSSRLPPNPRPKGPKSTPSTTSPTNPASHSGQSESTRRHAAAPRYILLRPATPRVHDPGHSQAAAVLCPRAERR